MAIKHRHVQVDIFGYEDSEEEIKDAEVLRCHLVYWNNHVAPKLKSPQVKELTKVRAQRLTARLRTHPDMWTEILKEYPKVSQPVREASWVTFDWFLRETNLAKWIEGCYRPKYDQYHGGSNRREPDNGQEKTTSPTTDRWDRKEGGL